ncbi:MAG: ClpXP protease specificity-enhancing factor [Rhodoferax sp.]|nr:ClpXP protease specificity-enhancing factor [Rhodoferax sp.]
MIEAPDATSTRPYLIRAMYEWCTDNGFTPYIAVAVDESVLVPREYVKDGEIVLNISFDATSALKLGNEFIEFKGRFAGVAREIMVPVSQVIAIYARENGQGMAFPMETPKGARALSSPATSLTSVSDAADASAEVKVVQLASVESDRGNEDPDPPRPSSVGPRPALKRVK